MNLNQVQNVTLNDLSNICVAQLRTEQKNEKKSLKRTAAAGKENTADSKIRKTDMVRKLKVNYKSGSSAEFTVDANNLPNGKAVYTGHDGTLMYFSTQNGLKHGPATRYHPDGAIETLVYNQGIKEGPSTYEHSGDVSTGTFVNNALEGRVTKTSLSKGTVTETIYKKGLQTGFEKTTYPNGDVLTLNGNSATFKINKST